MKKIEISRGRNLALGIYHSYGDYYSTVGLHVEIPFLFNIFAPFMAVKSEPKDGMMDIWGATWHNDGCIGSCFANIHLNWGDKCKILHLPWEYDWVRTSKLRPNGQSWAHQREAAHLDAFQRYRIFDAEPHWEETYPFRYTRKNGEVQDRDATVKVIEMEWRQRWLKWCPLFAKVRKSIDISFDKEVGERSGSWKGGVIGMGYDMLPGESALDTLRRLQEDSKTKPI